MTVVPSCLAHLEPSPPAPSNTAHRRYAAMCVTTATRVARSDEAASDKIPMHYLPACSPIVLESVVTPLINYSQHKGILEEGKMPIRREQRDYLRRTFAYYRKHPWTRYLHLCRIERRSSPISTCRQTRDICAIYRHLPTPASCTAVLGVAAHRCFAEGRSWLWMMVRCACHGVLTRCRLVRLLQVGIKRNDRVPYRGYSPVHMRQRSPCLISPHFFGWRTIAVVTILNIEPQKRSRVTKLGTPMQYSEIQRVLPPSRPQQS